jgi:hypothetical protein
MNGGVEDGNVRLSFRPTVGDIIADTLISTLPWSIKITKVVYSIEHQKFYAQYCRVENSENSREG